MIKFFRHIRKELMEQNKTGRYFKYAIGEIILVMIGILLALQVNNWNNRRLDASKEQMFLKNLRSDFIFNLDELKRTNNRSKEAYKASADLLEIIKADTPINPSEIEGLVHDIINKMQSLDLISGSIDEIINTGSLNIIRDPELRKQLSNWSYHVDDTADDIRIYEDYLFNIFIPSLSDKVVLRNTQYPNHFLENLNLQAISKSNFQVDYNTTVRTYEFENEVFNNALNYMYALNSYNTIETYFNETLELIESNIK